MLHTIVKTSSQQRQTRPAHKQKIAAVLGVLVVTLCFSVGEAKGQEHYQSRYQLAGDPQTTAREPEPTIVPKRASFPMLTPATKSRQGASDAAGADHQKLPSSTITVASSLAIVLGLFAGLVWLVRKFNKPSSSGGILPREVFEQLGTSNIDPRTRIALLRCGTRILVVSQTPAGMQMLSEITDESEVRQLVAACSGSSKDEFSKTLQTIQREKPSTGFLGEHAEQPPKQRSRLFATA